MPKILLIFPPSTVYGEDPTLPAMVLPLGLAYIAGYLREHGFSDVGILDARSLSKNRVIRSAGKALYGLTDEEIIEYVKKFDPDIVGISCMYTAYSVDAHRVASIVKSIRRSTLVLLGGAHASTFSDLVLKDTNIDYVVHAEGEETFLDFVKVVKQGEDPRGINGISFRDKSGVIVKNASREFIKNLDEIPFPARDLLDMNLYLEGQSGPYTMRFPYATMITSRGCPNACIYCTIRSVWGEKRWRGRSAKNVVDEIELLVNKYGIKEFYFMDDSAGTSKERLSQICQEIIARKLDIRWTTPNGIAHWFLDEDTLRLMKKAGCYRITFGIESGNLETRKFLGKPFPLEQAKRMITFANKIGMWTVCTFIIGFPYETEESIKDTIRFACECGTDMAVFYLLSAYPGTKVYEIFRDEGFLNLDHIMNPELFSEAAQNGNLEKIGLGLAGRGAQTKYFSPVQLQGFLTLAYKTFFRTVLLRSLSPVRFIRKIRSFEDLGYLCKIARIGLKMAIGNLFAKVFISQKLSKPKDF